MSSKNQHPSSDAVSEGSNGGWARWSMYLIKGIQDIQNDIGELYRLYNEAQVHDTERLQSIRLEIQAEFNRMNIALVKLQIRSSMIGGAIGSIMIAFLTLGVYLIRHFIVGS